LLSACGAIAPRGLAPGAAPGTAASPTADREAPVRNARRSNRVLSDPCSAVLRAILHAFASLHPWGVFLPWPGYFEPLDDQVNRDFPFVVSREPIQARLAIHFTNASPPPRLKIPRASGQGWPADARLARSVHHPAIWAS
jgi:hypothetical protein